MHGILLLDKPLSLSSNAALQRAKRLFGIKKAGHTGSLDPLATGMLPLCFGEATKFSQYLLESDKYYRVTAQMGCKTTTGDAEGEIIATASLDGITQSLLEKILPRFMGEIKQIPPMFSALKLNGQPLYKLARKGIEVERAARSVQIFNLKLLDFQNDKFTIDVHCSKGTYIRTLIEDIGNQLGCGAYVANLHRIAVAPYENAPMYSLDYLTKVLEEEGNLKLKSMLLPIETALLKLPAVKLTLDSAYYFRQGQPVRVTHLPKEPVVRIFDEKDQFLGLGTVLEDGQVTAKRLIALN